MTQQFMQTELVAKVSSHIQTDPMEETPKRQRYEPVKITKTTSTQVNTLRAPSVNQVNQTDATCVETKEAQTAKAEICDQEI